MEDTTYLDHAGATLYSKSLIEQVSSDLKSNLFGNPHSASPSSKLSTQRIDKVRVRTLQFFKADPQDFDLVFVANATAGIKLVAEAFHDYGIDSPLGKRRGSWYGYHKDSHTSLVGVRQLASPGATCFESDSSVDDWIAGKMDVPLNRWWQASCKRHGLFAYPAQSNLNGHRLPLDWPGRLRNSPNPRHRRIYTLLDASAYVTTAQLDLINVDSAPDFTALSFYKIFGFPDLGGLIVRRQAGHMLQRRRYFGGGTVDMVITGKDGWHAKKQQDLHEQLEDGTLPFHSIIALGSALDVHERLYGSMACISRHSCELVKILHSHLCSLKHANGEVVCEIYKDSTSTYGDSKTQGPIIAFNIRDSDGEWIGKSEVERLAIKQGIHLRTGGVCNPGGIATSLTLSARELRRNFATGMRCGDDLDVLDGKPTGVVRVSLGAMSSLEDVERFVDFVKGELVEEKKRICS